jgi:hypothetical protein
MVTRGGGAGDRRAGRAERRAISTAISIGSIARASPFRSIAARAIEAPDTRKLLDAARDLYLWKRTVTRDTSMK